MRLHEIIWNFFYAAFISLTPENIYAGSREEDQSPIQSMRKITVLEL